MIVLRAAHVVAGAFWVGAAVMLVAFVVPAARSLGADGGRYMQRLLESRFPAAMGIASLLTTAAGLALWWPASGGFEPNWLRSAPGLTLSFAALLGIAAFTVGMAVNKPTAARLAALGAEIASTQAPSARQAARMAALQRRLGRGGAWGAALLVLSTLGMAAARYVSA